MTRFEEGVFEPFEHVGFLDHSTQIFPMFWVGGLQTA